jgi:hypothetical protein
MARWADVSEDQPEFATRVRASFDANLHKALATLRRDGSPRISGTEMIFAEGEVWCGSMRGAVKARDLRRDPRYAIHGASDPGDGWIGDGKISGRATEISDQGVLDAVMTQASEEASEAEHKIDEMHLFRLAIEEVVWTGLNEDRSKLVIESWHPDRGLERRER